MVMVADVHRHPALLKRLSRVCPNSIRVLPSPYPVYRYTCLMQALRLIEHPGFIAIARLDEGRVFADAGFVHWLIDNHCLRPVPTSDAGVNDLVFYFDGGRFRHAGILLDSRRAVSKWGRGQLYEHGVFEVPMKYGSELQCFSPLSCDAAFGHFSRYAARQGVSSPA